MAETPRYPIIYVRGYAMTKSEITETTSTPYMGLELGSTKARQAWDGAVRKVFVDSPAEFDPRKYLGPARDQLKALYKHKIVNVLGSANKA